MYGFEWFIFVMRSGERSRAREGDTMWLRPLMAREMSYGEEEERSWVVLDWVDV